MMDISAAPNCYVESGLDTLLRLGFYLSTVARYTGVGRGVLTRMREKSPGETMRFSDDAITRFKSLTTLVATHPDIDSAFQYVPAGIPAQVQMLQDIFGAFDP